MKQIVNVEQAKRLVKSRLYIGRVLNYQPTIGELIEWIRIHTKQEYTLSIMEWDESYTVSVDDGSIEIFETEETELIDALVELVIKIKEETK